MDVEAEGFFPERWYLPFCQIDRLNSPKDHNNKISSDMKIVCLLLLHY